VTEEQSSAVAVLVVTVEEILSLAQA